MIVVIAKVSVIPEKKQELLALAKSVIATIVSAMYIPSAC